MQVCLLVFLSLLSVSCILLSTTTASAQQASVARGTVGSFVNKGSLTGTKYFRYTTDSAQFTGTNGADLEVGPGFIEGQVYTLSGSTFASLKNNTANNLTLQAQPSLPLSVNGVVQFDNSTASSTANLGTVSVTGSTTGGNYRPPAKQVTWPIETYAPGFERSYSGSFTLTAMWTDN